VTNELFDPRLMTDSFFFYKQLEPITRDGRTAAALTVPRIDARFIKRIPADFVVVLVVVVLLGQQ
jgi:hypothetical protein